MTEKHKRGPDGLLNDGVSTHPATAADLATYTSAQQALRQLQAPVLYHANNAHERLFVACFDGTGNDAINDPEHATNVGRFKKDLEDLQRRDSHIFVRYVEGPGTQDGLVTSLIDKATGHTYSARLEEMYSELINQAKAWRDEDPQADIRLIGTGFSRGGDQAAGFARVLHERGIQDPSGRIETRDAQGRVHVEYTKPPLVPPGQVAQALGLFDPVGTGEPSKHDRRLPSSVLSAVQIVARDETRDAFPSTRIVPQGLSADGRTLGLTVAGAHSDIGGSYHLNGLGVRNGNMMADYFNTLSDTPLMHKQPEPLDPRLNVIHHTQEHIRAMGINLYGTSNFREDGLRDELKPAPSCRAVYDCGPPEPVDVALSARFERQPVTVTPARAMPVEQRVESSPRTRPASAPVHMPTRRELDDEAIRALQHNLNRLGFTDPRGRPLADDGYYSPGTQAAVSTFQREQGLPATGIADAATLGAIQAHVVVADLKRHGTLGQPDTREDGAPMAEPGRHAPPPHAAGMGESRTPNIPTFVPPSSRPIEVTPERHRETEPSAGMGRTPQLSRHEPQRERLSYSDPVHPHHSLFRELRHKLPADVSDEKVAELTLAAREGGVRPNRVESVHVLSNGEAWVLGTIPGFDGMVNLRTPAPPMAETMQKAEVVEQQLQMQAAQWQQQRESSQSHGRSM